MNKSIGLAWKLWVFLSHSFRVLAFSIFSTCGYPEIRILIRLLDKNTKIIEQQGPDKLGPTTMH